MLAGTRPCTAEQTRQVSSRLEQEPENEIRLSAFFLFAKGEGGTRSQWAPRPLLGAADFTDQ